MALTERQKTEAQELFAKGYTTDQVFRHFGAQSIGKESEIDIEESAIKNAETKPALKPLSKKITGLLGLDDATQTFGDIIARNRVGAAITGTDVEANRANIPAPTGKEIGGALLQTGATVAGAAIAPASLPAQIAAGGALGYAYDVGGDLLAGSSTSDTLTPGVGTAVGTMAPPVLKGVFSGLGKVFGRGADEALALPPGAASEPTQALALPEAPTGATPVDQGRSVVGQTVADTVESVKRFGRRMEESAQAKLDKAQRLETATPAVREAINAELDDTIIDFATKADPATKADARRMVQIAESPKKLGVNERPAKIAEDAALTQYDLVLKNKKKIGEEIGKISDQFDTLKSIDVTPTQDALIDVMKQNGLTLNIDGKLVASDNMKITDEQIAVINKLFDKVTKQNKLSAKNIHELDQWFSSVQRSSRMVDKIDDVYVKVPTKDGGTTDANIFKVFRDAFGQRLDKVAPDNLRTLNRQYRQYSNFLEDVEGRIVKNPEFSDLVGKDEKFAEAGLRRMFGAGQGAADREVIYEALDRVSRELGYQGARADDLYAFALKLNDLYPETVEKTSLRGQFGASIMDKLGMVIDGGKVAPQDQQKALKMLLEMD